MVKEVSIVVISVYCKHFSECIIVKYWMKTLRQHFYGTGSNWNRKISGRVRPCVSTELLGMVPYGIANLLKLGLLSN